MAKKAGFVADRAAIGRIAKTDPGIKAAVHALAERGAASTDGATVEDYVTDRSASAIVVRAEDQVADGAATKALGAIGGTLS